MSSRGVVEKKDFKYCVALQTDYAEKGFQVKVFGLDITDDEAGGGAVLAEGEILLGAVSKAGTGRWYTYMTPPRETWTVARCDRLKDGEDGRPRVARDQGDPWGDRWLRAKDRRQARMGGALLRAALEFTAEAAAPGMPATAGRPSTLTWRSRCASTWELP